VQPPVDEVKHLRRETHDLKEVVAEQALELRLLKKSMIGMGATRNEISRLRETGNHSDRRAVASAGEADTRQTRHTPPTFYRWYDRFLTHGVEAT
jgi:hypothetical protein